MTNTFRLLVLIMLTIVGCDSEPEEPVEWIEDPLSEATYFSGTREFREGDYDILVLRESALEFKLGMNEGDSIVYHWTVDMEDPAQLAVEFHGHTERVGEAPGNVMFYKVHSDGAEAGTLIAPYTGIHGWYLNNTSNMDINVKLRVAGFYQELH